MDAVHAVRSALRGQSKWQNGHGAVCAPSTDLTKCRWDGEFGGNAVKVVGMREARTSVVAVEGRQGGVYDDHFGRYASLTNKTSVMNHASCIMHHAGFVGVVRDGRYSVDTWK